MRRVRRSCPTLTGRRPARVPRSLLQLGRSKSYFCWKHGPPQHTTADIQARLARYRAQLRRNLIWFQATGRLGGADARRRLQVQHATVYPADCVLLHNDGDVELLEHQVDAVWSKLQKMRR